MNDVKNSWHGKTWLWAIVGILIGVLLSRTPFGTDFKEYLSVGFSIGKLFDTSS